MDENTGMPMDDLVLVDNNHRLCGWLAGMSREEEQAARSKYNVCTYGQFCRYWEQKKNAENNFTIDNRKE